MTNSWAVGEMLPLCCMILAELISIASTPISLQQWQSISLTSFLQCPHLHQLRFPSLIRNKLAAAAYLFHGSHYHICFSVQVKTEMVEKWWNKSLHCHLYFFRITTFLVKYKSDMIFSVFLSLDQNLMKPEKRSYHLPFNKFTKDVLVKHPWIQFIKKNHLIRNF